MIIKGKYTIADVKIEDVEEQAINQIQTMVDHEAFTNDVKIMPDVHMGKGSVVGFTMPLGDKIVPNVVGVDGNCAMLSVCIGQVDLPNLLEIDARIRKVIPMGMNWHEKDSLQYRINLSLCKAFDGFYDNKYLDNMASRLGTLGGGNHFIEFGKSEKTGDVWITIHTGSRNFGLQICDYWQKKASKHPEYNKKEILEQVKKDYPKSEWNDQYKKRMSDFANVVPSPLDYLEGNDMVGYLSDMMVVEMYAKLNRRIIMANILRALNIYDGTDAIETIHNYIDFKDNIIRKGAIRSYVGEKMLIPLNPVVGILICEGKSNPDWNFSAPHGAGRIMSRSKAYKNITDEMAKKSMGDVFSTLIPVDENPLVYKDPKVIEAAIEPTANILDRLIPILPIKAVSERRYSKH